MGVFLAGRLPASVVRTTVVISCLLLLALSCGPAACGGGTTASTETSTGEGTSGGIQGKQVTFKTEDGVALGGHLFGTGSAGVVLSHMYPADQKSWYATAKKLAAVGYMVLTYDFRGYGVSGGNKQIQYIDRDVYAAVKKITAAGATKVVLIGASMGGTASLKAAERLFKEQLSSSASGRITVAGVATLSAPVVFQGLSAENTIPNIYCPLLFVAAKKDVGADGALELERLSGNTGDLEIVAGSDHGTDLLSGTQAAKVYDLLLRFLRKTLPLGA